VSRTYGELHYKIARKRSTDTKTLILNFSPSKCPKTIQLGHQSNYFNNTLITLQVQMALNLFLRIGVAQIRLDTHIESEVRGMFWAPHDDATLAKWD
jgi:hypothetical protein